MPLLFLLPLVMLLRLLLLLLIFSSSLIVTGNDASLVPLLLRFLLSLALPVEAERDLWLRCFDSCTRGPRSPSLVSKLPRRRVVVVVVVVVVAASFEEPLGVLDVELALEDDDTN